MASGQHPDLGMPWRMSSQRKVIFAKNTVKMTILLAQGVIALLPLFE
jgi:hypothetical protein